MERAVGQTIFVYCPLAWPEGQPERSGKATVQERKAERGKGNLEAGKEERGEGWGSMLSKHRSETFLSTRCLFT